MGKGKIRNITYGGILTALVLVATMFFKVPNGFKGYINLGDGVIFISALVLGPFAGLIGAIGSSLADLFSPYVIYAPATFIIKGIMGFVAGFLLIKYKSKGYLFKGLVFVVCEIIMVGGYFIYETALFGIAIAIPSVFPNIIQALAGIVIGLAAIPIIKAIAPGDGSCGLNG